MSVSCHVMSVVWRKARTVAGIDCCALRLPACDGCGWKGRGAGETSLDYIRPLLGVCVFFPSVDVEK